MAGKLKGDCVLAGIERDVHSIGDLLTRLSGDAERVEYLIYTGLLSLCADVVAVLVFGSILLALMLVLASESWSEEPQSAKDFFPRQGIIKTYRCTSGTGPIVRQTYRERDRFQGKDATALVEDLTTPDGKTEHSIYYYGVLDDSIGQAITVEISQKQVLPSD